MRELGIESYAELHRWSVENREELVAQQHQAARWTYLGSGMVHERFKATLDAISPKAAARIAEAAPMFA